MLVNKNSVKPSPSVSMGVIQAAPFLVLRVYRVKVRSEPGAAGSSMVVYFIADIIVGFVSGKRRASIIAGRVGRIFVAASTANHQSKGPNMKTKHLSTSK